MSRLLNLPPELRLHIWNLLLAPDTNDQEPTLVSRACGLHSSYIFDSRQFYAHSFNDDICKCNSRPFYIHDSNKPLYPVVLRTNLQIYNEALPSLYARRIFSVDPNRRFMSLWDRYAEAWFLLGRFLVGLSADARNYIKKIRLPMLLSKFEVHETHEAFYSVAALLPCLQTTEIEVSMSSIQERWHGTDDTLPVFHGLEDNDDVYFIGPLMAFADTKIAITAVDKQDLGDVIFARLRPHIEMRVWKQLLPLRMKRERRKISRIKNSLRVLDHSDVTIDSCFIE